MVNQSRVNQSSVNSVHNEAMAESLSALMDGEASELEVRRLLKAVESDVDSRQVWSRYQTVSSVMKGEPVLPSSIDLSGAIQEAIADEAVPVTASTKSVSGWRSGLSRLGVAASVAAVMVVSGQLLMQNPGTTMDMAVSESAVAPEAVMSSSAERLLQTAPAPALPAGFQSPAISARTVSAQAGGGSTWSQNYVVPSAQLATQKQPPAEIQHYLQQVMDAHAGNAASSTGHGMLPYARVPMVEE